MRFSNDFLAQLKDRVPLSALIGKTVPLKRQGREYAGLSPFNKEKSPSFFVNDEKQFYHCFSSGKHGDAITFLMEVEGLTFPEAVERLAGMAGMALPERDGAEETRQAKRKDALHFIDLAARFYEARLAAPDGAAARAYLGRRELPPALWQRFRLGFAPEDRTALRTHLLGAGADEALLVEAGLLTQPEDGRRAFDRFSGRLMFPISDPQGRICGFGGRVLEADRKPKYLNSPDSPYFDKGRLLYNYPEARKALATDKGAGFILVEGYVDVAALVKAGFAGAVAPLGTALSADQLALLWRSDDAPILCFDGDSAGLRAAYRAIERALPLLKPDKSLRFCFLPDGHDPDDMIRRHGASAMHDALSHSTPLVKALIAAEESLHPLDTPERIAGLRARLRARVAAIADHDVRAAYGVALRDYFAPKPAAGSAGAMRPRIVETARYPRKADREPVFPGGPTEDLKRHARSVARAEDRRAFDVLARVLAAPELLEDQTDSLIRLPIADPDLDSIRHAILDAWFAGDLIGQEAIDRHLDQTRSGASGSIAAALLAGADLARAALAADRDETLRSWREAIAKAAAEADLARDLAEAQAEARKGGDGAGGGEDPLRRLQDLARSRQGVGARPKAED